MAVAQKGQDDVWIPTTCYMCYNACNIIVHRVNGVVVKIEGNPKSPHNSGRICAKGNSAIMGLYNPYRIKKPLKRTNPAKGIGVDPGWQEISWDEALDTIAGRLKKIRETDPRKLYILTFDTQGWKQIGKPWAETFGTPHISSSSASYYCGNGLHPVSWAVHGAFFAEPDFHYNKYCLLFGSGTGIPALQKNPIGLGLTLAEARQDRGAKLVAIDPFCNTQGSKADEWIPIRPGTDAALALAMANVLINEEGIYDREFLVKYTNAPYLIGKDGYYVRDAQGQVLIWDELSAAAKPFDAEGLKPALEGSYEVSGVPAQPSFQRLKEHVTRYTPENVEGITTVPAATTRRIAREFGEAASIGSSITLDGKVLPLRPVAANWSKGAMHHKHSNLTAWAIQLLNTLAGAVDVPGGQLGPGIKGPDWAPTEGPDGLLVASPRLGYTVLPYPPRKPSRPKRIDLLELFPAASYSCSYFPDVLLHPEKYGMDYNIEMLIHSRTNFLMTSLDPPLIAEALKKIPFMVSFVTTLDETAEMADIVLPDAHVLERLDALPNRLVGWILPGPVDWYWTIRQPVVDPPPGVKHWVAVLLDLAERMGMLDELTETYNVSLKLKEPFRLKPGRKYTQEEIIDAFYKSEFDAEHGVEWFKKNGLLLTPKSIEEAYPRPFIKARLPIYVEYYLKQAVQVKEVTSAMGLKDWDVSDYQPLPDWRPCPAYGDTGEFDLYVVNCKQSMHTFAFSVEMSWLNELMDLNPDAKAILINPATGTRKGLKNGGQVRLRSTAGKEVSGTLRFFEGVHPEVVVVQGIQGHWAQSRKKYIENPGVHFNSLISYDTSLIDTVSTAFDACVKIKIENIK